MTVPANWRTNAPTLKLVLCLVAIILGVVMFFNVLHVGTSHRGLGILEITLGVLFLF